MNESTKRCKFVARRWHLSIFSWWPWTYLQEHKVHGHFCYVQNQMAPRLFPLTKQTAVLFFFVRVHSFFFQLFFDTFFLDCVLHSGVLFVRTLSGGSPYEGERQEGARLWRGMSIATAGVWLAGAPALLSSLYGRFVLSFFAPTLNLCSLLISIFCASSSKSGRWWKRRLGRPRCFASGARELACLVHKEASCHRGRNGSFDQLARYIKVQRQESSSR